MVAGAALNALNELAKDTAYTIAKNMLSARTRGDLQTTIWEIIAKRGNDNDIALFEQRAPYFYGTKKISFVYSLSTYLLNVKDYKSFERALAVQEKLIATESIKTYRSAMVASMFQTASNYKDQLRDARTNVEKSRAQQKLDMMKTSFERIIKEEKEEESKTQYTELLKTIYN
jgi:aminopeptidase N